MTFTWIFTSRAALKLKIIIIFFKKSCFLSNLCGWWFQSSRIITVLLSLQEKSQIALIFFLNHGLLPNMVLYSMDLIIYIFR